MLQQQSYAKVTWGLQYLLQTFKKLLTDKHQEKTQSLQLVHPKVKWMKI